MSETTTIKCDGCGQRLRVEGNAFMEIEARGVVRYRHANYDTMHLCWPCWTKAITHVRAEVVPIA